MGLIGAHISIAGGVENSIERGEELNCEAIQIFVQSSRTWKVGSLRPEQITAFKTARKKAKKVKKVIAHNSYLINLSTADNTLRRKSVDYFLRILEQCEALGIESLITHPGSHLAAGEEIGIKATTDSLNEILTQTKGYQTQVLLENTAGQGSCIGHRFEHLKQIVDNVKEPERIFYCFDTQHAFAAGYDLRTPASFKKVFEEFEAIIGCKKIQAFHLNDALKDLNSRVDRHENIGKGFLGKEPFKCIVNDQIFKDIPLCLETDPGEENENYRREIQLLRKMITKK